jgi:hypothetical protein
VNKHYIREDDEPGYGKPEEPSDLALLVAGIVMLLVACLFGFVLGYLARSL